MKTLSKYNIAFKGLKEGDHHFEFKLDDQFFEKFENSIVQKGNFDAKVTLKRQASLMILKMSVKGKAELECDRCLDNYLQKVKNSSSLYIKFGSEAEEMSDDVVVIPFDEYQINVAHFLYELVILGLPIKHVHPDDEFGNSTCNPGMVDKLNEYLIVGDHVSETEETQETDDRWNELKKLLDNKQK